MPWDDDDMVLAVAHLGNVHEHPPLRFIYGTYNKLFLQIQAGMCVCQSELAS